MPFCDGCFVSFSRSGLRSHLSQTRNPRCRQVYLNLRRHVADDSIDAVVDRMDNRHHHNSPPIDNEDIPDLNMEVERYHDLGGEADFGGSEDDGMDIEEDEEVPDEEGEEVLGDEDEDEDEQVEEDGEELDNRSHEFRNEGEHWEEDPPPLPTREFLVAQQAESGVPLPATGPPSGRLAVEENLRQPVVIDKFPNEHAGAPVTDYEGDHTERSHYAQSIDAKNRGPYAPFSSRIDWEFARWAKLRGPGSTAMSELLSIKGVQKRLGLSYKNSRELNNLVDELLPSSRPRFHRDEIRINDEAHELYYHDVLDCVRCLYGSAEFAPYLVFTPEQHYSDPQRTAESRLYHDMHTGKWWWWTQEQLEKETPGATVVPIILSSDKTQVTTFGGKDAYPVYMTIGNLPKEIRRKPSRQGQILLAYLPTSKFENVTNKASRRRLTANLFHGCMRLILEPLTKAGKRGVAMASGDGVIRRCHPILGAYSADYMEQIGEFRVRDSARF